MNTIKVPETKGPKRELCWKTPPLDGSQGNPMLHCDRAAGHIGMHTWEYKNEFSRLLKIIQTGKEPE